ncbi:EAL domain-containing protein [Geminicoccaceae bacterium 1502E]|nr:EAL domain-containing protein [Geminicoccaceae bacterium 1502E]
MLFDSVPSRVRTLIDRFGAAVFVLDVEPDGGFRFVATNRVHERHSGLLSADLEGRRLEDCLGPALAAKVEPNFARCARGGTAFEYEEQLDMPVGRTWWRTTLTPLFDPEGNEVVRIVGTAIEISDVRRSEQRARVKAELLEAAEALAGIGHWRHDLETGELVWSAEMLRIHGLAPDDPPPSLEQMMDFYHPEDRAQLARHMAHAGEGDPSFAFELRLLDEGSGERWVRGIGHREARAEGQPAALFGVLRDVTEERRREAALVESEARFRRLYDATPAMLLSVDAQYRLVAVSDHWLARMGYARDEVLGRPIMAFVTEASFARNRDKILDTLREDGAVRGVECEFLRKDGRIVEVVLSTVAERDEEGSITGCLTVLVDISGRKEAERALARTQQMLTDAIECMRDAFTLFDKDGRLLIFNQRIKEIYPLIGDLLVPGVRYEALVRAMVERGQYRMAEDELEGWVETQVTRHQDCPQDYELHLSDGRWIQISTRRTSEGGVVSTRRDVTHRKQMEFAIAHMAMHDGLTDLPNRSMFREELERVLARAGRERSSFAVLMGDLDGFKAVNDSHGHATGDRLLIEVGRRLMSGLRAGDMVARLGGDEFAILAFALDGDRGFGALADRLVDLFRSPFEIDGQSITAGLSLGVAVYPDHAADAEQLLINADAALYAAKRAGRHGWRAFERGMAANAEATASLELALRKAIAQDELLLHYQPILDLQTEQPIGAEALLRWRHPSRGLLAAGAFLPAADRRPVIMSITRWTIAEALRQQKAWQEENGLELSVWVNLAARSFRWDGLVEVVEEELRCSGVAPERLVLEITEGSFADLFHAEGQIAALQRMGIRIALDDFGAGHSSLARLRDVTVDVLKIDRSFVANLAANGRDDAIVHTIIALGATLDLATLAEGIETRAQCDMLRDLGCPWGQGYHFARPMPAADFLVWAQERARRDRPAPPGGDGQTSMTSLPKWPARSIAR